MAVQSQRERAFAPGYEPSAPPLHSGPSSPYADPEYARYVPRPPSRPSHSGGDALDQSLGGRVMHIASGIFQTAWQHSSTILRFDLRQSFTYRPPTRRRAGPPPRSPVLPGASVSPGGPLYGGDAHGYGYDAAVDDEYVAKDASLFGSIRGGGARVKLLQVSEMPPARIRTMLPMFLSSLLTYLAMSFLALCKMGVWIGSCL